MTKHIVVEGIVLEVTNDVDENDPDQLEALTGWAQHLAARAHAKALSLGARVRVKNTMLFDGRVGEIIPTSGHPDEIWDRYVSLEPDGLYGSQRIGVMLDQVELLVEDEAETPVPA